MRIIVYIIAIVICIAVGPASALVGPYVADDYTLHLYHLDGSGVDSVTADPIALTFDNGALADEISPFEGYNAVLSTFSSTTSSAMPIAAAAENIAVNRFTGSDGAFTFEAMINLDPSAVVHGNMQIVCGEGDGSADRGWQFRISSANYIEFINIAYGTYSVAIPTSGANAFAPGNWYHIAVTYNGQENTPANLNFYWTLLGANATEANLIGSALMPADTPSGRLVDFSIGNEARDTGGSTENLQGLIDEVRISSIARTPAEMLAIQDTSLPRIVTQPLDILAREDSTASMVLEYSSITEPAVSWYCQSPSGDILLADSAEIQITDSYDSGTELYTSRLGFTMLTTYTEGIYYAVIDNGAIYTVSSRLAEFSLLTVSYHWTFDQTDYIANAYSDIAGDKNAAVIGDASFTQGIDALGNTAAYITDANGSAVAGEIPLISAAGAFTISLWANLADNDMDSAELFISESSSGQSVSSPPAISSDNNWQHLAIVYDNKNVSVYIDAKLSVQGTLNLSDSLSGILSIGADLDGSNAFEGAIDDLQVYNFALSPAEIEHIYNSFNSDILCRFCLADFASFLNSWLDCGLYPTSACQ